MKITPPIVNKKSYNHPNLNGSSYSLSDDNFIVKYIIEKYKVQGAWPSTLFFIQHELGNAYGTF